MFFVFLPNGDMLTREESNVKPEPVLAPIGSIHHQPCTSSSSSSHGRGATARNLSCLHSRAIQEDVSEARIASLTALWPLLTRSLAPLWQKEKALKMALWPRAFYGTANGNVAPAQIRQLRTDAMRALGHRRAGASPVVRLFLLCGSIIILRR